MGENILELQNLSAWYSEGKNVLSDFSLQLRPHEVVGLIGLNGAGKTTFLKTLSGLHEGFRCGSIYLNGQAASFRDKGFKLCRYTVFAEDNSFQYFTFREYLYQLIAGYKEYGTVLFSSHILESITQTSDRVLVLEDGQIRRSFAGNEINAANIREALHDENEL